MLLSILSILVNVVFLIVLNLALYTDRAMMPTGEIREWHRSPVSRLAIADQSILFYIQLALVAVSIVSSALILFGVRADIVRKIQLISLIASAVMFIVIMIVTSNSHAKYA